LQGLVSVAAAGWVFVSHPFTENVKGWGTSVLGTAILPALNLDIHFIREVIWIRNRDGEREMAIGQHADGKRDRERAGIGLRPGGSSVSL
jgi:hypothetical protein